VIPIVTNPDQRRTWRALVGKTGVSKEIRDRIQKPCPARCQFESYDRWNYVPEKCAGMETWEIRDGDAHKKTR
jgi:hypothetical protein